VFGLIECDLVEPPNWLLAYNDIRDVLIIMIISIFLKGEIAQQQLGDLGRQELACRKSSVSLDNITKH